MIFIFFCYLCIMKYIILLLFTFCSFAQENKITLVDNTTIDPNTNCELRYYYFPNLQMYYDFKTATYIYIVNGTIMESSEKPQYGYSVYNDYRVLIKDYDDNDIINYLEKHKKLYPYVSSKRPRTIN